MKKKINRRYRLRSGIDFDENFEYIAGYTSGGFSFGVAWKENFNEIIDDQKTV